MGDNLSDNSIVLQGTHGTFNSNFGSILKNRLNATSSGRIGSGVYLWKEGPHSRELAIAWIRYKKESTNSNEIHGIILFCECLCDKISFIDIEDEKYKLAIYNIAIKSGRNLNDNKEISMIHDEFIYEMENKNQIKIEIVQGKTPAPPDNCFKNCPKYPHKLLGYPYCLAIRNPNCVIILNKEAFKI